MQPVVFFFYWSRRDRTAAKQQRDGITHGVFQSFSGQGFLATGSALAVLLGADVGTTLVAQLLTFDLSALSSALIATGVVLFSYSREGRSRDVGRLAIGLGLMLLALQLIVAAFSPMRGSAVVQALLGSLNDDLIFAVIVVALIAWAAHYKPG